jgi:hypothetical protein
VEVPVNFDVNVSVFCDLKAITFFILENKVFRYGNFFLARLELKTTFCCDIESQRKMTTSFRLDIISERNNLYRTGTLV